MGITEQIMRMVFCFRFFSLLFFVFVRGGYFSLFGFPRPWCGVWIGSLIIVSNFRPLVISHDIPRQNNTHFKFWPDVVEISYSSEQSTYIPYNVPLSALFYPIQHQNLVTVIS